MPHVGESEFEMKYEVKCQWSGYSRGVSIYIVEAESEEEARELWYEGDRAYHKVVRDDTEVEIESVAEFKEAA